MDTKIRIETPAQMRQIVAKMKEAAGATAEKEGRRKYWRLTVEMPGTVELAGPSEKADPLPIRIRNISEEGLGLWSRQPLSPGRNIIVSMETDQGTLEVPGTVTYCTGIIGKFRVGVLLDLTVKVSIGSPPRHAS